MLRCMRRLLCLLNALPLLLTACTLQNMQITRRLQESYPPREVSPALREEKIKVGMTMGEVRALLPEPDTVDVVADGTWWGYFFSDEEVYFLRFTNSHGDLILVVKSTKEKLQKIYGVVTPAARS